MQRVHLCASVPGSESDLAHSRAVGNLLCHQIWWKVLERYGEMELEWNWDWETSVHLKPHRNKRSGSDTVSVCAPCLQGLS